MDFFFFFRNHLLKQARVEIHEVSKCLMHSLQNNVSPFHLLLELLFKEKSSSIQWKESVLELLLKEKVTGCNERGMICQKMGVVNHCGCFSLEHVINFEGLVTLKFIRKVCQTISLQEILQSIFIKLMALIFPMSILIQENFYTFAEYELIEKIMGALWSLSFSAPF